MESGFTVSLGPFQGVTTSLWRRIFFPLFPGYDRQYAPFVKAVAGKHAVNHYRDVKDDAGLEPPLVPQLLCKEGDALAESCARLAGLGFREVNLNMGCPFPMVANKARGSGILDKPELIDRMLGEGLPGCPIPVSVKLRTGRESKAEMHAVARVLDRYPLAELIMHPRTGVQMYEGEADLDAFGEFLSLTRHPVAYNGDMRTVEDFLRRAERFPAVRHWMLGRGALRDPFLALDIKAAARAAGMAEDGSADGAVQGAGPPPPVGREDRLRALRLYHDRYLAAQEARFGRGKHLLDLMKSFWSFLAWSFPGAEDFLVRLRRVKDFPHYDPAVEGLFRATAE